MLGRPMFGTPGFGTIASASEPVERGRSFGFQRGAKSESMGARRGLNALPGNTGGAGSFSDVDALALFTNGLIDGFDDGFDDGRVDDGRVDDGRFGDAVDDPNGAVVAPNCEVIGVERSISTMGIRLSGTIFDAS